MHCYLISNKSRMIADYIISPHSLTSSFLRCPLRGKKFFLMTRSTVVPRTVTGQHIKRLKTSHKIDFLQTIRHRVRGDLEFMGARKTTLFENKM